MNTQIIKAKIIKINNTFLEVVDLNKKKGIVHISEISDYYVPDISKIFQKGQKYWFFILNNNNNNLKLSWKKINPRFLKNPFEFNILKTKEGFKNLKENTQMKLSLNIES